MSTDRPLLAFLAECVGQGIPVDMDAPIDEEVDRLVVALGFRRSARRRKLLATASALWVVAIIGWSVAGYAIVAGLCAACLLLTLVRWGTA